MLPSACARIFEPQLDEAIAWTLIAIAALATVLAAAFIYIKAMTPTQLNFAYAIGTASILIGSALIYHAAWVDYRRCWR
jgi:hypothetical protein